MIQGRVRGLKARVEVVFRVANQQNLTIEGVIDTGFAGALTLAPEAVAALGLPYLTDMPTNLANNETVYTKVYLAAIVWDDEEKFVPVYAMGKTPLIGNVLLENKRTDIDWTENGEVLILQR